MPLVRAGVIVCASAWALGTASCGIPIDTPPTTTDSAFVLATDTAGSRVANREMLAILSNTFYRDNPDEFDMLVFWGSAAMAPGNAFFLPVRNDVAGIGYGNVGHEFFDYSPEFGSERLQGIIWIGPDWIDNAIAGGPDSVLGILAQETAHRWGATIHFRDDDLKAPSDALLGSPFHWSFLLDSGASPLGGNAWVALGDGLFRADPVEAVRFSALDLYLMGLLDAAEVGPIRLLATARGIHEGSGPFSAQGDRVRHTVTVRADVVEVSVDQVIDAEGLRNPEPQADSAGLGFTAAHIRQAWIIVSDTEANVSPAISSRLRELASEWPAAFADMTDGRGSVRVTMGIQ